ncbi:hypothetical protein [Thalassobacillus devorans]|uniref:hypothetical protein n=1 Tax=Thalassobacillus devorans TaxID=279813 RepID=UPI0004ACA204|nr:hypothetical protein [Thalassobacillus devorans]
MKKLLLVLLIFTLLGSAGLEEAFGHGGQAKAIHEVLANRDPGDGGMGSWK